MEMNLIKVMMMMMLMLVVCAVNGGIVDEVNGMVKKYVEDIKKDNYEFYIKERNFFNEVIDEVNEIEYMKDNESKYHKIKMLLIKIVFKIIMELDDDDKENILNMLLMISDKDIDIERDVISIITDYDNIHSHLERLFPLLNRSNNNNNNHSNISNQLQTNTSSLLISNINQTISSIDHKMFEVFLIILLFLITYGTYLIKRNPIKNTSFETVLSSSSSFTN